VTGAHGSGKTTVYNAMIKLIAQKSLAGRAVFDMDGIIDVASELAGRDIRNRPSMWPTYNNLWMAFLGKMVANGLSPLLFTPLHPDELPVPDWCERLNWIRLECPEQVLRTRLVDRGWGERKIDDTCEDACHLEEMVPVSVSTHDRSAIEVARDIQDLLLT
jgi:broad-specificity NMP kinase